MVSLSAALTSDELCFLPTTTAWLRTVGVLASAMAVIVPVRFANAQAAVSGQVSVIERAGARTTDLADAVVWLEPRSGGQTPPHSRAQIVMESREFVPRVRVVSIGSSVGFPNQDPFRHNVFSKSGPGEFDLGLYGRGRHQGRASGSGGRVPGLL